MRTDELITAISADAGPAGASPGRTLSAAVLLGAVAAGILLALTIGVREDMAAALGTLRFPAKFLPTLALAATAFAVLRGLSRPYPVQARQLVPLALPALILATGVAVELAVLPPDAWLPTAEGRNALLCLTVIPALSATPLVLAFLALRRAAPAAPALAGAVAGLLAGGIGATFYALHCPDDSPLFLAVWYVAAIAAVTAAGALAGGRLLRW
jgi:hypothetical protein